MTCDRSTWNTSCLVRPKPGNNPAHSFNGKPKASALVGRDADAFGLPLNEEAPAIIMTRNRPWTAWMNEYRFGGV